MKVQISPINKFSLILYIAGFLMVFISWANQWTQLLTLTEKLQMQLLVVGIIVIAVAAIINLSLFLINNYFRSE